MRIPAGKLEDFPLNIRNNKLFLAIFQNLSKMKTLQIVSSDDQLVPEHRARNKKTSKDC